MDIILETNTENIIDNNYYCNYCYKTYSTKTNLLNHQRTAKFCIEGRNKTELTNFKTFNCEKCNKSFTRNDSLRKHNTICKVENKKNDENVSIELLSKLLDKTKILDNENFQLKNEIMLLNNSLKFKDEQIKDLNEKYNILLNKIIKS
jgi:hypothetical protein